MSLKTFDISWAFFFQNKGGGGGFHLGRKLCLPSTHKLLFGSTGCDRYCSNSRNRIFARVWDFHCFFVVNNTGEPTV